MTMLSRFLVLWMKMSEVNQEPLERCFITTAEHLPIAVPLMQSSDYASSTSLINMNEIVGYGTIQIIRQLRIWLK